MEEGTIAKWFVKAGDKVASGDILAEIETDKATMEFEAVDEGTIADIAIPAGTDGVKVGTVIALLVAEGEDVSAPKEKSPARKQKATEAETGPAPEPGPAKPATRSDEQTSELPSLMRLSYAVFCLKKKKKKTI